MFPAELPHVQIQTGFHLLADRRNESLDTRQGYQAVALSRWRHRRSEAQTTAAIDSTLCVSVAKARR